MAHAKQLLSTGTCKLPDQNNPNLTFKKIDDDYAILEKAINQSRLRKLSRRDKERTKDSLRLRIDFEVEKIKRKKITSKILI